ncbi:hypothetical protein JJB07_00410 [Tumebacillus sp. ITR2]|uniref:General stress protein 17M-like domain-containing protein n=1 Tax=Tumebacillus amylolyticus TaxID=2801339 RepID=A0ABS1J488_9BACL|nr:hypothetical protein [Tumebacillus amylolyticus]MBL0385092.1 hypothetical protein [Tumebacillus amylolyticus]
MNQPQEQAILAYFSSPDEAQIAAERVQHELDIDDVQVDRFSMVPGEGMSGLENPIQADFGSHGELVEGGDGIDRNTGVALGADPAVSGMSDGYDDREGLRTSGRNYLVTVVAPIAKLDEALNIINECGGMH